jgi:hypothetical protein
MTSSARPDEPGTDELADLPVDGLPPDAPERGSAAVDSAPAEPDPAATAHDPDADRGARTVMTAYAAALADGSAAAATDLFAESGAVYTETGQHIGRDAVRGFHDTLLADGPVAAHPAGQGNDTGRLELDDGGPVRAVELAFDASGRIGSARWLGEEAAALPQEERVRRAL